MSLITRCPACATTFKVVPDQLRISDGWVRCGQCTEVFDAPANLLPDPEAVRPDPARAPTEAPPTPRVEPPAFLKTATAAAAAPPSTRPGGGLRPSASAAPAPATLAPGPRAAAPPLGQYAAEQRHAQAAWTPALPERLPTSPVPGLEADLGPAAKPPSADELLAEQLARLDLDLSLPPPSAGDEATRDELSALDDIFDIVPERDLDLPAFVPAPESLSPAARVQPQGDRFPVLSVPELDLPGQPEPVRPAATGVTLGALQFPGDPAASARSAESASGVSGSAKAAAAWSEGAAPAMAPPPPQGADPLDAGAWDRPLPPDEVSPSLLSESQAGEAPGDLSAQWAAEPAATAAPPLASEAPPPVPPRSAQDEVDAYGRPELQQLQFLKRARQAAFWRQTWVRLSLFALCLLASAGLALQVVWHERDRLAATEPLLKPGLQALCQSLGCELAPLRRIEPWLIESSSFNKARGDNYQFALTVHNTGALALAMPAAELTLTDAQDQAVLRRVFRAEELGAPASLAAGAEWSANLPVSVAGAAGLRIAGYRVMVFYP